MRRQVFNDKSGAVFATLDIDHADDYAYDLRRWDLARIDENALEADTREEIAAWVESVREEYRAYERDQRLEMFEAAQMHRWFKDEDRGGVA